MNYEIIKMDNLGRGITYTDNIITFVPKTIIGDIVTLTIIKDKKKYREAVVSKYIKRGSLFNESDCPFYQLCGGCHLRNLSYLETINYKKQRIIDLFNKYLKLTVNPEIVLSKNIDNYRNKLTINIVDGNITLKDINYQDIVIDNCLLVNQEINRFLPILNDFNINNGRVVIRCNYLNELLISIDTKDKVTIPNLDNFKIKGIIVNNKVLVGDKSFIQEVNNLKFNVSYDAFFQVNNDINEELFKYIKDNLNSDDVLLDLYCGVGTLGINASFKVKEVLGIEIVENAILDAIKNKELNKCDNIDFLCGDVKKLITTTNKKFDAVIIDPPRSGIDQASLDYVINTEIKKVIYIACDPNSLVRDLSKLLDNYQIIDMKVFDMFPYTYHVETVCVLERKN